MGRSNPTKPTVVMVRVGDLIPYARNARTHSDAQIAQIAASIKEFGWTNPILVDGEKGLIAGHGRLAAARKLGMEEVPVIELTHLSETQKKALILADNKLALNADWDEQLLDLELEELELQGFDISLAGFQGEKVKDNQQGGVEQSVDAVYEIAVTCESELQQEELFYMLTEKGYKCRVLTM